MSPFNTPCLVHQKMPSDHKSTLVGFFRVWCALFMVSTNLVGLTVGREVIRHYKWEVGYVFWAPDCLESAVIGINGGFPGPTIRAREGDTIVVEVTNALPTEGVVIHWHGINQIGTPWADGTASISQCAINPGERFVYRFIVDKAGTYFYHGHYGMQRSGGLYGSLIVDVPKGQKEPFHYDAELNLILSDWWHESIYNQMIGLSSIPFRWIGEPQTLLIQGKGQFNCSPSDYHYHNTTPWTSNGGSTCMINNSTCPLHVLHVKPNKTYRLRVSSMTSLASLNFAITNHTMVLVEADGNYLQPTTVEKMDIYSGESYSVLITTNQDPSASYWISTNVRHRRPKTQPGLAILTYKTTQTTAVPRSLPPPSPTWNDTTYSLSFARKLRAHPSLNPKPPKDMDRRIVLLNTQNKINGYMKWSINNISLNLPSTPYLGSMRYGLKNAFDNSIPPENYPEDYNVMDVPANPNSTTGNGVYIFNLNSTVDIILQNANTLTVNNSEVHPWHLHGHDFWVLGYGLGKFNEKKDMKGLNFKDPPLRNTVSVFPYGWTAIRFIADNPGVWAFHCHIEPHLHMGMGVIFAEGVHMVKRVPPETMGCGLTRNLMLGV